MRHIQIEKRDTPHIEPALTVVTPELLTQLQVLLTQTTISQEQPETPQITETATGTQTIDEEEAAQPAPPETLFLTVSDQERNKVIAAYRQGIPRREICSHLKWGSSKYSTIVKPVLDAYEQQEQQTGTV